MNDRRVAFFLPSLAGGGAERVVANLALEFVDRGFEVDVVLQQAAGPYLAQVADRVRIVDLKARRMALCAAPLVSYLRQRRPRALLSGLTHGNIMAILSRRLAHVDTRVVVVEHNMVSLAARSARSMRARYMNILSRAVYRWADEIVAVSEGVADDLAATLRLPRARIEIVYNAVVTPEVLAKSREELEHPWFRAGEPPVVLGVGRLTQLKGFAALLRAFALVRRERACRLVLIGEGEERPYLESLGEDLGINEDVHMPGFVDNPYKYMARASVFVLSSIREGLPTVLIEAMACGTRVISTDCQSGPKVVLAGGKYGLLVPVGDVNALAAALSRALIGGNGFPLPQPDACSPFTPDVVVPRYVEIMLRRNRG